MYCLSRLSNNYLNLNHYRIICTTNCLFAEPLKKKKRMDPAMLKKRTESKLTKLKADINRLEKAEKKFKPIIELHLTPQVVKELQQRKRSESDKNVDLNAYAQYNSLLRLWSMYRNELLKAQQTSVRAMVDAQNRAINHLKSHSTQLYDSALTIDDNLIPYTVDDVRTETPANNSYKFPDGKVTDVSKNWVL